MAKSLHSCAPVVLDSDCSRRESRRRPVDAAVAAELSAGLGGVRGASKSLRGLVSMHSKVTTGHNLPGHNAVRGQVVQEPCRHCPGGVEVPFQFGVFVH